MDSRIAWLFVRGWEKREKPGIFAWQAGFHRCALGGPTRPDPAAGLGSCSATTGAL